MRPALQLAARQTPLLVWIITLTVFFLLYSIFFKILAIDNFVLNLGEPMSTDPTGAYELRWRMLWGLSAVVVILVALANAILSMSLVLRHRIGRSPYTWILIGVCAATVAWLSAVQDYGGAASHRVLLHYSEASGIPVNIMVEYSVGFVLALVVMIAAAILTITLRSASSDAQSIIEKHRDLRRSLTGTTVLLVVLVFQTYFLFRMATVKLDPEVADLVSNTLTIGGSASYTILLLVLYGPVALTLEMWSLSTATREIQTNDPTKVREWLQKQGIYNSPARIISQFMMGLSPALVGVLLDVLPRLF